VRGLGADQVIDYKKQKIEDILRDYDAVFDNVGGETYARSFKVLKKGGRIVSMVEQVREDLMKRFGVEAFWEFTQVTTDRLAELTRLVNLGALKVRVERTFPLERAAAALAALEKESPRGKVVVEVA
jgi:alcohol dehydrogenase